MASCLDAKLVLSLEVSNKKKALITKTYSSSQAYVHTLFYLRLQLFIIGKYIKQMSR